MDRQLSDRMRQFIREHQQDNVHTLALQAKKYSDIDLPTAIVQIAGRQLAEHKIPSWYATDDIIYPVHLPLEQCSSEITAKYKASLLQGETLVDLTGGFGVDCAFLSAGFQQVTYVEKQKELCEIAVHNFATLGLHQITVQNQDSTAFLEEMPPVDCIFIDPARRNEQGRKTVLISDCEPNVEKLENLLLRKARRVMIKLSPMLDLSLALRSLPHTCSVHILSVQNECKELLLILEASEATEQIPIHCINFTLKGTQTFIFTLEEEKGAEGIYTDTVRNYLYEPNASILKAGAFRSVACRYHLEKLHPNSHLYTSNTKTEEFPGRVFRVEQSFCNQKEIARKVKKANITVRNYHLSATELRKRTKIADGGDIYLFATTLANEKKQFILGEKV